MRARRIENEWKLLQELEARNPAILQVLKRGLGPVGEFFRVGLNRTAGPIRVQGGILVRDSHQIEFSFPRFFPAVPIEATLQSPIFHPNVDPGNGFVCLWSRTCAGDTVIEAAFRTQRIIAWDLVNFMPDHLMQQDAVDWYRDGARSISLPCAFEPLISPEPFNWLGRKSTPVQRRQRLFS